jgi:hypothetical protein
MGMMMVYSMILMSLTLTQTMFKCFPTFEHFYLPSNNYLTLMKIDGDVEPFDRRM